MKKLLLSSFLLGMLAFGQITIYPTGGGGGYATIQDEGSSLNQRVTVNFLGSGVTCVDNPGASKTDCTVSGGGSDATYRLGGTLIGQRPALNFISGTGLALSLVDNPGSSRVDYTPSIDTAVVPTKANIQSGASLYATTGGTSTAYTLALSPTLTAYATGSVLAVKFHTACGATPTLNVDALGARKLYKSNGTSDPAQLGANECRTTGVYLARYDAALDAAVGGFVIDIGGGGGSGDDFTGTGVAHVSSGSPQTFAVTDDTVIVNNGTVPELKAVPNCTDTGGNHLNYTASTNAFSCGTSGGSGTTTFQRTRVFTWDEFLGGGVNGQGTMGKLGWGHSASQGTCGVSDDNSALSHPGVYRFQTSGTSGDTCAFGLFDGNSPTYTKTGNLGSGAGYTSWEAQWVIKTDDNSGSITSHTAEFGFKSGNTARAGSSIAVRYSDQSISCTSGSNSTTEWMLETISGGSSTCVTTGVTVTGGTWYTFRMFSTTMGTVQLEVSTNGGAFSSAVSSSTNVPTASMTPMGLTQVHTAAVRRLSVDYFAFEIVGLTR